MWGRWDFHPQHGAVVNHCPPRVTLPVSVLMLLESCITAYSNLFITEINSCSLSIKTSFEKIVRLPLTPWLYHLRFSFVQERKHRGSFFSIPSANLTFVLRGTRFFFSPRNRLGDLSCFPLLLKIVPHVGVEPDPVQLLRLLPLPAWANGA